MEIVTNNPKVRDEINDYPVYFIEGNYKDVLLEVHKKIVNDKKVMITHPLSGSIKPNETCYKSIIVSPQRGNNMDMYSLDLINQALDVYDHFQSVKATPDWTDRILEDFAVVDFHIIQGALSQIQIPPRYL